jgi:hypothetical protein
VLLISPIDILCIKLSLWIAAVHRTPHWADYQPSPGKTELIVQLKHLTSVPLICSSPDICPPPDLLLGQTINYSVLVKVITLHFWRLRLCRSSLEHLSVFLMMILLFFSYDGQAINTICSSQC